MAAAAVTREVPVPSPTASTNLQKMLELEHKLKMERLQHFPTKETPAHPPPPVPTNPPPRASPRASLQSRRKDSLTQRETFTMIMSTLNRESPALSITVPPANRTGPIATKPKSVEIARASPKQPHKTVTFVADDTAGADDHKSDASSICHSPSWEGYGQRKKEKKAEEKQRRKDKEQAEKDAREAKRKSATRLHKRPPSASRTNLMLTGRTSSTPEPPESSTHSRRPSFQGEAGQSRRRSSSVTSQIRAALTGVLGGKEKEKEKEKEEVIDQSVPGFVGGLKLEKERESAAREAARSKAKLMSRESQESVQRPQHPLEPRKAHSFSPTPTSTESLPSPLPRLMSEGAISGTPQSRQKAPPPISMRASSRSETLISPTAPPVPVPSTIEKWRTQTLKDAHKAEERGPKPIHDEGEEVLRGRRGSGYVQHHRKISHDRAISNFNDEAKVSAKSKYPPQANRHHHTRAYSITTDNSSPTSPTFGSRKDSTGESRSSSAERGRFLENLGSFGQPYNPPVLDLHPPQGVLQKPAHERSRSRDQSLSRGFRGAMQAAFQKVRPSSRPPASASTFFDRHSRDMSAATDSAAASRPPSSSSHLEMVNNATSTPAIKVQDSARPSSSSSSNYDNDDSLRSPSFMNTPDSSRPQSDRGLPPVVGEVGKGKAETLLITNDERVFRLSHSAQLTYGTPTGPSPVTPRTAFAPDRRPASRNSFTRDTVNPPQQDVAHVRIHTEHDLDSFKSCETPIEAVGSTSSLVPLPLEISPISSPQKHGAQAREAKVSDDGNSILRAPSLSKSRSSPNVITDTRHPLDTNQPPLVPPQRSPAREKHAVHQSSVSLPDALDSPAMHPSAAQRSPNPAAYLEEARKAVPSATPMQRHPRAPRITGGRQEGGVDPIAKMFVECCHCKFFHDMPSRVYECMAHPEAMVEDPRLGVSGAISTVVNCPWCKHGMSTECCAGYAAVVYLKERLH